MIQIGLKFVAAEIFTNAIQNGTLKKNNIEGLGHV
jgi:hypothetical protein